jgi:hypothetical protein
MGSALAAMILWVAAPAKAPIFLSLGYAVSCYNNNNPVGCSLKQNNYANKKKS